MAWPWDKNKVNVCDDQQKGQSEPCIVSEKDRKKYGWIGCSLEEKEGDQYGCHVLARLRAWLGIVLSPDMEGLGENSKCSHSAMWEFLIWTE